QEGERSAKWGLASRSTEQPAPAEHEQVNRCGARRKRRRRPFRNELLEVAAYQNLVVVGGKVEGVGRSEQAGPRGEQKRYPASARSPLRDHRDEPGKRH